MPIINRIADFHEEMTAWRRDLHAHPETAFEEFRTADMVAEKLRAFGIEVHRGLVGTGVVGTLHGAGGPGRCAIGLRADMDALDLEEVNEFAHKSRNPGKMHGCGHDGHTAMLLGAARYLAETRNFDGTVHFIFQPAEENEAGGRRMVEEGLFDKFPVAQVFGLHNWPQLSTGRFAVRAGPMMAAADFFEIAVRGNGAHGAMPHLGIDPVVAAAQIVTALQTLVSRATDPLDAAVISVTQIHAGHAFNVIPGECRLGGTVRSFKSETRDRLEEGIDRVAKSVAAAFGATSVVRYDRRYPATVNGAADAELAARVAAKVVGAENVLRDVDPSMGAEDFAYMLNERPGAYIWLGQGGSGGCMLHNGGYDFNDEILPIGASYWATLVETALPREA